MIKIILIVIAVTALFYIVLWLHSKWQTLSPQTKKNITYLGLLGMVNIIKTKWHLIFRLLAKLLK